MFLLRLFYVIYLFAFLFLKHISVWHMFSLFMKLIYEAECILHVTDTQHSKRDIPQNKTSWM